MVTKNEKNILIIAGVGGLGYLVWKSGILQGLGKTIQIVGGATGETAGIARDTARDIERFIYSASEGAQKIFYQTGKQGERIVYFIGETGQNILRTAQQGTGIVQDVIRRGREGVTGLTVSLPEALGREFVEFQEKYLGGVKPSNLLPAFAIARFLEQRTRGREEEPEIIEAATPAEAEAELAEIKEKNIQSSSSAISRIISGKPISPSPTKSRVQIVPIIKTAAKPIIAKNIQAIEKIKKVTSPIVSFFRTQVGKIRGR